MSLGAAAIVYSSSHPYSEILKNWPVNVFEKKMVLLAFSQRKGVELNVVSFC